MQTKYLILPKYYKKFPMQIAEFRKNFKAIGIKLIIKWNEDVPTRDRAADSKPQPMA